MSCPICLGTLASGGKLVNTTCGHAFHEQCLETWTRYQDLCPACREGPVVTRELFLSFLSDNQGEEPETDEALLAELLTLQQFKAKTRKASYVRDAARVAGCRAAA